MILATHGILGSSIIGVSYDTDAQNVINAIQGTGVTLTITQKNACNELIVDLKTYGIWTKIQALYGFLGGTASAHKFNWKDPRDLDVAFRLLFSGGGTHDSTGYIMNGTDSFANTYFNPSTFSGWKDNHNLSIYLKTTMPTGNGWHLGYGNTLTGDPIYGLAIRRQGSNDLIYDNGNYTQNGRIQTTITDAKGFWCGNSVATNDRRIYKNGVEIAQRLSTVYGTPPNDVMTIGATNGISGTSKYYLSGINSLTCFSYGLSLTELTNFNTAVNTYQTILSRNN